MLLSLNGIGFQAYEPVNISVDQLPSSQLYSWDSIQDYILVDTGDYQDDTFFN
ncbi:MAG: hypothetical protein ACXAEU_19000 [Candidatus Hodarchaeales archaeon]